MEKRKFKKRPSGSKRMKEPKVIGEVLIKYFESEEPFAVGFRNRKVAKAEAERDDNRIFENIFPCTELGVDLKLMTRQPGRMPVGTYLPGVITHDSENHYLFFQNADGKKIVVVRNPHLYKGKCVNVIKKEDMLFLTFNRPHFTKDFTFQDFCREAAEELLVVAGLVER